MSGLEGSRARDWRVAAAVIFACLNASLIQTIVLSFQSDLPALLGVGREITAWVVTAAVASACAFAPVTGRLGDLYGRKRVALALIVALAIGSLVSALATSTWLLIAGRTIQGLAIGIVPLGMSMLSRSITPQRQPAAIALAAGTMGIGGAFGIPLGAVVAEAVGWRGVFWVSVGLAGLSCLWVARAVPRDDTFSSGRFDVVGSIAMVAGCSAMLIGLGQAAAFGWRSPLVVLCVGGGALLLAIGALWMALVRDPLINVRVALRPTLLMTNLHALCLNFAAMATMVVFPQVLVLSNSHEVGLGVAPVAASMIMMANGVAMALVAPVAPYFSRRWDEKFVITAGACLVAIGALITLVGLDSICAILVANLVIGGGFGLAFAVIPRLVMSSVPREDAGSANGLNAQVRIFGTAAAAAVIGALLASGEQGGQPSRDVFVWALILCAVAAGTSALLGLLVPRRGPEPTHN